METIGDIEELKKKIEEQYQKQITETEASTQKEVQNIAAQTQEKISLIEEQAQTDAKEAAKEAKQRVFNEQKLKAKKEFEFAREKIVQKVLEEVKKQAPKIALSNEYIGFAKKNAPKGTKITVFGNSPKYKKHFSKMIFDKSITGLRFESENIVHDMSVDKIIEANEDAIRRIIVEELLGEKEK